MKVKKQKMSFEEAEEKRITDWPIWTKEISNFPWHYEQKEECYFLEGKVRVKTEVESIELESGDFVVFPQGLSCSWDVIEPVRKHYRFC